MELVDGLRLIMCACLLRLAYRLKVSHMQWCSGAGTRRNAVPVNIFLPEQRSGRNLLSQPER